jgi:uncharacterized membrane protein YeaQ/YmgE (transglycosylase-associated protein family)
MRRVSGNAPGRARDGDMLAGVSAALIALILIVFFMAFGFGLLGFALSVVWSLIWYSIVGLVIGGLGRLLVSGRQELGLLETALFGIAGALLGGIIANDVLDVGWFGQFLTAVVIAALLVLATGAGRSRSRAA